MANLFMILALVFGVLALLCGFGYNYYSNKKSSDAEEKAKLERLKIDSNITDKTKEILETQKSTAMELENSQKQIENKIDTIKKSSKPNIKIDNSPNSTIQFNEKGDNIINQTKEEYKPKFSYFKKETKLERDPNTNLIRMTFFFGSEDGFPLINPKIDILFNEKFTTVDAGVTGSGMVSAGDLKKQILNDNQRFILSSDILQIGNYFFIETLSKTELKIQNLKINP